MELPEYGIAILIFIGLFIYLNIGYLLAHISWKSWDNRNTTLCKAASCSPEAFRHWYEWLLFPPSAFSLFDENHTNLISDFKKERNYKILLTFFWPVKVAVNIFNICTLIGLYILCLPLAALVLLIKGLIICMPPLARLFTYPVRKIFRINSI